MLQLGKSSSDRHWMSLNLNVTDCHNVTECHWIYLKLNEIIVFGKLKFIKIQSIKIYLKLEKIVKMLVKNYLKLWQMLKIPKNGEKWWFFKICQKMVKCWKMLVKTLKKMLHWFFLNTMDIKNIIFNPKFYQHFLPSLFIT